MLSGIGQWVAFWAAQWSDLSVSIEYYHKPIHHTNGMTFTCSQLRSYLSAHDALLKKRPSLYFYLKVQSGRCENLSQLGPVARMPALSAQACRTVASATACVEIPTLDVHRLPCGGVAPLLPRLQEPVFTLYGATTRS